MTLSRAKFRRAFDWLSIGAVAALVPKCVLCFGTYAGLGTWLTVRLSGREVCTGAQLTLTNVLFRGGILALFSAIWFWRDSLARRCASWIAQRPKARPSLS